MAFKILFIYLCIFFIANFSRCCGWLQFAAQPKFFLFLLWASRRLFCHNINDNNNKNNNTCSLKCKCERHPDAMCDN